MNPPEMGAKAREILHKLLPDDTIDAMPEDEYDDLAVELARQLRLAWFDGAQAGVAETQRLIAEHLTNG